MGVYTLDAYEKDEPVIMVKQVNKADAPVVRTDDEEEKRVELHLHTKMSMMDAVTSATDYINRAKYWGHRAIAITDHGVVQAYPEAAIAAKKADVKVLYGVEGYMVDDTAAIAKNVVDHPFDGKFVVFDIETTGLSQNADKIIEIGAVKIENGVITDRFSSFINPHQLLEPKIIKLTNINDEMLAEARDDIEVIPEFLDFIEGSVLVAHNAPFDTGFMR
ncbi:MAG: PHP domain-containing protein, partial [Firmicutes bacterium]|nr:PHP domain-containing protein [Bacillota bacterium]